MKLSPEFIRTKFDQMEVSKMAETGSRYSIMQELNTRKVTEKETLAELERQTDAEVFATEEKIDKIGRHVKEREGCYKAEHRNWKRQREIGRDMMFREHERKLKALNDEIKERDENYEQDFVEWKTVKNQQVTDARSSIKRYKEVQGQRIKTKKEIIAEIEMGINDLKEMSSEQGKQKE